MRAECLFGSFFVYESFHRCSGFVFFGNIVQNHGITGFFLLRGCFDDCKVDYEGGNQRKQYIADMLHGLGNAAAGKQCDYLLISI